MSTPAPLASAAKHQTTTPLTPPTPPITPATTAPSPDIVHQTIHPTPTTFPQSHLYELRATPTAGRGVFATRDLAPGTHLMSTSDTCPVDEMPDPSPIAWLIQRPYRKEVCAECFLYDRGREWRVKAAGSGAGVVFCSDACRDGWVVRNGSVGVEAWGKLEAGVQRVLKLGSRRVVGDVGDIGKGPGEEEVEKAWVEAGRMGEVVVAARRGAALSRCDRKLVKKVTEHGGDPDLMYYILTAVVSAYHAADRRSTLNNTTPNPPPFPSISTSTSTSTSTSSFPLPTLLSLTPTPSPLAYNASHTSLPLYTASYLHLLTLLPLPLLRFLTPSLTHNLNTRAAHNAFSIRPASAADYDNECLGWGVWPAASFWNHSCRPNVRKRRVGRAWVFDVRGEREGEVGEGVSRGDELCISYLGGEEEVLGVRERRDRLWAEWGFRCRCCRCVEEENEEEQMLMGEMKKGNGGSNGRIE